MGGSYVSAVEVLPALKAFPLVCPIFVNDRPLLRVVYKLLAQLLESQKQAVLVDVGANTGSFALLPVVLPGLYVEAFEPLPSAYEILLRNIQANGIQNEVKARNMALSAEFASGYTLQVPTGEGRKGLSTLAADIPRITKVWLQLIQITCIYEGKGWVQS